MTTPVAAIITTVFLVNLRHLLMSMSASRSFSNYSMKKNIGIGLLLTDESFAVLMTEVAREHAVSDKWMAGLNVSAYLTWITSTIVGGIIGRFIPNPKMLGLDYALVAMFAGLFISQAELAIGKRGKTILLVLATVFLSLYGLMYIVTPEIAVMAATLLGCIVGVLIHGRK
jgi:4-azaleucine resistance transporter AzlC